MADITPCPGKEAWEGIFRCPPPAEALERLAGHVEGCPVCVAAIAPLLDRSEGQGDTGPALARLRRCLSALPTGAWRPGLAEAPLAATVPESPAPAGASHVPAGVERLGQYWLIKLLGSGGMGLVYLAEDSQLQRRVAVQVMRPDLVNDDRARQRFLREARTMA